ncbi:hypothetical protein EJ110_NYTH58601 [Nymphaea thermarum]|nr:hypothetical protein EJ110_NYTH58601 [Nymphaea thermarum]
MSPDCGRSLGYGIDPDMNYFMFEETGKTRLRVKAGRLSVIEEAEISSSVKELVRVEEARGSMRKVFGWEPTRGELSKVLGSEISAMQSSLKRGWYSRHTLLGSFMGLIRSIASKHQGRGIAIEDHVQSLNYVYGFVMQQLIPDEEAETATEMFMRELLGSISPREAEVLTYRYGFQTAEQ